MKKRGPGKKPQPARRRSRPAKGAGPRSREPKVEVAATELPRALSEYTSVSPVDSGGDVDADWQRAQSSGEETVGGSVATPDQDVVDELARPLGVERSIEAAGITSDEILSGRDRKRWRIEQQTDERARDTDQT